MPARDPSFYQSWFGEIPAVLPTRPACGMIRGAGARDAQNKWREKSAPRTRGQYREECLQVKRAAKNGGKFAAGRCDMRLRRGMPAAIVSRRLPPCAGWHDPRRVAEWSKAPHSKCGIRASVSWVRIPTLSANNTRYVFGIQNKLWLFIVRFPRYPPLGINCIGSPRACRRGRTRRKRT